MTIMKNDSLKFVISLIIICSFLIQPIPTISNISSITNVNNEENRQIESTIEKDIETDNIRNNILNE